MEDGENGVSGQSALHHVMEGQPIETGHVTHPHPVKEERTVREQLLR